MAKISKTNSREISTYLKRLKFDPKLAGAWIARYLVNLRLVLLLVTAATVAGIASYIQLPRSLTPDIKIPLVIISTVLPGAGPADIESLITNPIEDSLQSLERIQDIQSTSTDSVSIVTIQFESGVDAEKAKTDVQSQISGITDFPQDAQTPRIDRLDFENTPVWTFDVTGMGDEASLFRFANDLKDELEGLPSVDRVEISGLEEQEVEVVIKPELVSAFSLNPQQVIGAVTTSLNALPAGNVVSDNLSLGLSMDPAIVDIDDIRNLKLNILGKTLLLSDIAEVAERSKPDQASSFIQNAQGETFKAVSFNVFRVSGINIENAADEAKDVVNSRIEASNGMFSVLTIQDLGELISEQFGELQRDFILTVILVVAILFIFLGARQAMVSSLTAPITFFITFIVMNTAGIGLNFISIFSLLLSLGLLVDDTIVVISATTAYHRAGKFTPVQTGLLVFRDFLAPVLTTTITTVWAFLPLLLTAGIIGEFIKPIPIVTSTTLIASIFTALFIALPLVIFLLKPQMPRRVIILIRLLLIGVVISGFAILMPRNPLLPLLILAFVVFLAVTYRVRRNLASSVLRYKFAKKTTIFFRVEFTKYLDQGIVSFATISYFYKRLITKILTSPSARVKTIAVVVIFSLFSYLLFPLGLVKNEFFPSTDQDSIYVSVELPAGTKLPVTTQEAKDLLSYFKDIPDVNFVVVDVGRTFSQFGQTPGTVNNNILFSVHLNEKRDRSSSQIAEITRSKFAAYTKGKVSVEELAGGPPVGADLEIKLFGDDLALLNENADQVINYLSKQAGVVNADKTIKPGASKLVFVPDKQKIADNGLTNDQVGLWLRFYLSGLSASEIKLEAQNNVTRDIVIRLDKMTPSIESLTSLNIPTATGRLLPLSYLGEVKLEQNPTQITHADFKRIISVTGDVIAGFSVMDENRKLESFADSLELPLGYSWETGGVNEENQRSVESILQAMLISFILIVVTMIIQFNSYRRALIVMLVIPLSIAGVFIVFGLTNTPLTFPGLVGVLALFGIVVKNAILVVDKIVANIKTGLPYIESIADGASSRLEPIALTSMATIFGLIPITLSDPLWRGLGGAIIAGLTFSGTIMLLFIPVVYYYMFREEKRRGRKPA